jgi:hypothetical protein
MKKFVIKISLAFVIIAAGFMIFLGLRLVGGDGAVPSYRFLDGQYPAEYKKANGKIEDSLGILDKVYTYSFEADFNDLCLRADAELIPAGFVGRTGVGHTLFGPENRIRSYRKKGRFPRGSVRIWIHGIEQYSEIPLSNEYALDLIIVEIFYYRGWRWPF